MTEKLEELEITIEPEGADGTWLGVRALAAYFKHTPPEKVEQPAQPEIVNHDGLRYVVLHKAGKVLAVFRVQNTGQLRRMRRPPKPILAHYRQVQAQADE